jgi:hypothetical protein
MPTTPTAVLMRSDPSACRETAAMLRDLGFAVSACDDESHLYASAIRVAAAPEDELRSCVILAEATRDVLQDLEVLRSGNWHTPLVLVGRQASPEIARRLRAACLTREQPTPQELRRAIDAAVEATAHKGPLAARTRRTSRGRRREAG